VIGEGDGREWRKADEPEILPIAQIPASWNSAVRRKRIRAIASLAILKEIELVDQSWHFSGLFFVWML
jgi:hypothetical protein